MSRLLSMALCLALGSAVLTGGCSDATPPTGGNVRWRLTGVGGPVSPALDSSTVYFGGYSHEVVAAERATGRLRRIRARHTGAVPRQGSRLQPRRRALPTCN